MSELNRSKWFYSTTTDGTIEVVYMTYVYQPETEDHRINFSWNTEQRNQLISCKSFTVTYMGNFAEIGPTPVETQAGTHFLIKICDEYPYPPHPKHDYSQLQKLKIFLSGLVNAGLLETTNETTNANANDPTVTYTITRSWRRVPENPLEFSDEADSDPHEADSDPQGNENPPANDGHNGNDQNPPSYHSQFVTNPYLLLSGEYPQHENKHI
jgi:hypothetical protein